MSELSSSTSIPTPFELEYYVEVADSSSAERLAHAELSEYRISANREFFRVTPIVALRRIVQRLGHICDSIHGGNGDQIYICPSCRDITDNETACEKCRIAQQAARHKEQPPYTGPRCPRCQAADYYLIVYKRGQRTGLYDGVYHGSIMERPATHICKRCRSKYYYSTQKKESSLC